MRRIAVYIFVLIFTVSLAHAGGHKHLATDSAPSCAVCTVVGHGMAPAPTPATAVTTQPEWIATLSLTATPSPDGRQIYRFAPKVSPPVSTRA